MADKKTCNERMPVYYRQVCAKPAKFLCLIEKGDNLSGWKKVKGYRCGIHAKRYEKIEEIKNG
jgi:hypothetical protein